MTPNTPREIANGTTPQGRTLVAVQMGDRPLNVQFFIDGKPARVEGPPSVYRDGGTRVFRTNLGTVTFPQRLGDDDRTPRLDGEPVT